jgi:hypothetical protein
MVKGTAHISTTSTNGSLRQTGVAVVGHKQHWLSYNTVCILKEHFPIYSAVTTLSPP